MKCLKGNNRTSVYNLPFWDFGDILVYICVNTVLHIYKFSSLMQYRCSYSSSSFIKNQSEYVKIPQRSPFQETWINRHSQQLGVCPMLLTK